MSTAPSASILARDAPPPAGSAPAAPTAVTGERTRGDGRRVPRLGLIALLLGTAVLYLWGLSASGYANSFYSAAAQAGSQSWKAFFFGSLDASNAITVDKPPASIWLMALSVRIFGLSSWSILAPQALLGVASVAVTYATVRRTSGPWPALLAGAVLALTPVATLMFRFNNPDALLVLCMCLAVWFTTIAVEKASGRWLALAGVVVGLGFLTKMLQAFLVLPALGVVYLIAAPASVRTRIRHLLLACAAMIAALGWWVAVVELVPASWRPYIGGSQNNSVLELIFGYNGLGRITGVQVGSVTGGAPNMNGGQWGEVGITRMFSGVSGGMVAWLIPAALVLAAFALLIIGRARRTDLRRAAVIMMTLWLLVTGLTFSFMQGIYHDYYTVALAPANAGTVAVAAAVLWRARTRFVARLGLAVGTATTTAWAVVLLNQATAPYSTLRWVVATAGVLATAGLLVLHRVPRVLAGLITALALTAALTGPTAYSINTAATAHTGSIVTAGPVTGGMGGGPGGGPARTGQRPPRTGAQPPGQLPNQTGQVPTGGRGGMGGLIDGATVDAELKALLITDAQSYSWTAAATGSQSAASFQLATGYPVMAIGGFNGSDPSPTLAQFQQLVAAGQIHYYIAGGQTGGSNGGSDTAGEIATWVSENFTASTVGGATVYDLTVGS